MSELAKQQCVPCRGGVPPLTGEALADLQARLGGDWNVVEQHHLEKILQVRRLPSGARLHDQGWGEMAEEQDHHPDIYLTWGRVKVTIWTHKIDGLTESDFVFAAKADALR